MTCPELKKYFPDDEDLVKTMNRRWGYSVFATLRPTLANKIMKDAISKRCDGNEDGDNEDPGIPLDQLELLSKFQWKSVRLSTITPNLRFKL